MSLAGAATRAQLSAPKDVAVDQSGNLFVADAFNNRVREVVASTGVITTVAGTGTAGYSGDGGAATAAQLDNVQGLALDPAGNLFVADTYNNRVREVIASTGIITTVAGGSTQGFSGEGGPAPQAALSR